jgi:hypothetical protein
VVVRKCQLSLIRLLGAEKEKQGEILLNLKEDLGIRSFDFEVQRQELDEYYQSLLDEGKDEGYFFQQMSSSQIKQLHDSRDYVSWYTNDTSSVWFLQGQNSQEIGDRKSSSWVSPFAVDQVRRLQKRESDDPFGYYMLPMGSSGMHSVLPVILYHLLSHRLCDLGPSENRSKLHHELQIYGAHRLNKQKHSAQSNEDYEDGESTAILQRVALAVLALYPPHQRVHIVLDRIDHCPKDEQYELMDLLGYLVQNAACKLKILLVADSTSWNVSKATYSRTFGGRVHLLELRQQLLTMGGESDY